VNTDISEIESETSDTPAGTEKTGRRGRGLALLAFVFSFAALAGTAWIWLQNYSGQDQRLSKISADIARLDSSDSALELRLKQLRSEVAALPSNDSSIQVAGLEQRLAGVAEETVRLRQSINDQVALSAGLQAAEKAMQERVLAAESALAGMDSSRAEGGGELDLVEVDYLLRMASERLQLFSDPEAADRALQMADMHLAAKENPAYLGLRQNIATARRELKAVTLPDYFAISNELESLQEAIVTLPFRGDSTQTPMPGAKVEKGWWEKLKGVFSGLVTVRRSTQDEGERLSLQDRDYIRQRLWLELEIARLSLMRRNQADFRNSLARVQKTLVASFDGASSEYQALSDSLATLNSVELQPALPDISAPWATLRLIRDNRMRAAPARPQTEPESATLPQKQAPETETPPVPATSAGENLAGDDQG